MKEKTKSIESLLLSACLLVAAVGALAQGGPVKADAVTPNDTGVIGSDDASSIQNAIAYAVKTGVRKVVIPAYNVRTASNGWTIARSVLLPGSITIVIDNATLTLTTGCYANFFRTEHTWTEKGRSAEYALSGIRIIGLGTAVLDGGEANDLNEGTQLKEGRPSVRLNSPILMTNARDIEVAGLIIRSPRYWGMCFEYCQNVHIHDIRFEAFCDRPNQDGIDLRNGCSHFRIENITGQTGDDTIALSAIDGHTRSVKGCCEDIADVTIRNVFASAPTHPVLAIRNHNGAKIRHVIVENLGDAPQMEPCYRTECARYALVRIGDGRYWRERKCIKGELADIHIKNLSCRYSDRGVVINSSLVDSTIEDLRCYGNCREAVTTEGPPGGTGATMENVTMRRVVCETDRDDSVLFAKLCLNPGDKVRNVRLLDSQCRRPDGTVVRIESQEVSADGPRVPGLATIEGLKTIEGELAIDEARGEYGFAESTPIRCPERPMVFTMHLPWGHKGVSVSYYYAPDEGGRPGTWQKASLVRDNVKGRQRADVGAGWLKYRISLKTVDGVRPRVLTQRVGDTLFSGWRQCL